jgi:hypothetical protein
VHKDDIPEDVMAIGAGIASDLPSKVGPHNRDFLAIVIARAILADRVITRAEAKAARKARRINRRRRP